MKPKTSPQKNSLLFLHFEPRRAKSRLPRLFFRGFTNKDVCVFIGIALFTIFSCERNATPFTQTPAQLTLSAEYVAVTEAWLRVQTENIADSQQLRIWRDTTVVFNGILYAADTTVYDSTLLPAHDYTYHAAIIKNGDALLESPPLKIATMDTTSHDFNWQIYTIDSPYGSGVLRDVAIISPTDIWCVGEIYADSAQPWLPYNAVHWDGQQWELKRIKTLACGGVDYPPIEAIFAFSADDILFAHIDGSITHFNGNNFINDCRLITQLNGSAKKMWGTSKNDLYVVSGNGFIAHYDGSWQKIESGTDLPVQDIWGAINVKTGEEEIICVASNKYLNEGKKVLLIVGNQAIGLADNGLSWSLSGVWFVPGRQYYIVGAGIFQKKSIESNTDWVRYDPGQITNYFTNRIRGIGFNDIAAAGAFGEIVHFNGIGWRNFYSQTQLNVGSYFGLDMKNNLLVAGGQLNQMGVIAIGRR